MPLRWEEVRPGLSIQDFTLANAVDRMRDLGHDPLLPVLTAKENAEFTLLLPGVAGTQDAPGASTRQTLLPTPPDEAEVLPSNLAGLHVLLMEPEVRSQLRMSGMLRSWGMSLHLADDVDEAMETLDELERVDFLLIDALMPDDGACVTIKKIRDRLGMRTAVISLLRAGQQDADQTCLEQGADDYVQLNCEARELAEVLIRHLPTGDDRVS